MYLFPDIKNRNQKQKSILHNKHSNDFITECMSDFRVTYTWILTDKIDPKRTNTMNSFISNFVLSSTFSFFQSTCVLHISHSLYRLVHDSSCSSINVRETISLHPWKGHWTFEKLQSSLCIDYKPYRVKILKLILDHQTSTFYRGPVGHLRGRANL